MKIADLQEKLVSSQRLSALGEALKCAGVGEAWLVGGALRDAAASDEVRLSPDLDVALPIEGPDYIERVAVRVASELGGSPFELDRETHAWSVSVKKTGETFDIVGFRAQGIEADLRGRDYTVNAIAWDLVNEGGLFDPLCGVEAVGRGELELCGPSSLTDDPLRVLRAYRLAATKGLTFAPGLSGQLVSAAKLLKQVSPERVRDELFAILGAPGCPETLRKMEGDGLLALLFPFIADWRGFDQGSYHSHDLLEHSLRCVEGVAKVVARWLETPHSANLSKHLSCELEGGITRLALLNFCALMHDVAKPSSLTIEGERRRFIGHDLAGAKVVDGLLKLLKTGKRARQAAAGIVGAHMRLYGLAHQEQATLRSRLRFIRDLGDETPEELLLCMADELATGESAPALPRLQQTVDELFTLFWSEPAPPPLIMGRDLVEELGLKEGRLIGEVLRAVEAAEGDGDVTDREGALRLAAKVARQLEAGPEKG